MLLKILLKKIEKNKIHYINRHLKYTYAKYCNGAKTYIGKGFIISKEKEYNSGRNLQFVNQIRIREQSFFFYFFLAESRKMLEV